MSAADGWLRRNRWWLLVLPVALLALVVSSSYFLKVFWYDGGLHHRIAAAEPGAFVAVTDSYSDAYGETNRSLEVRLGAVGTTPTYPGFDGPVAPPPEMTARYVRLDFKAEPDQVLHVCDVEVEDTEGRRYRVPDPSEQITPCLPSGRTGPAAPVDKEERRGDLAFGQTEPRPPEWSVTPVFLMPDDAVVKRVLVWWERPDYVELPAP